MREQQPWGLGPHQSFRSKLSTSTKGFHCFFFFCKQQEHNMHLEKPEILLFQPPDSESS